MCRYLHLIFLIPLLKSDNYKRAKGNNKLNTETAQQPSCTSGNAVAGSANVLFIKLRLSMHLYQLPKQTSTNSFPVTTQIISMVLTKTHQQYC